MTARRIITRHLVKRTALRELSRLWAVQARAANGDLIALAELGRLRLTTASLLTVRHEPRRLYKWAVTSPPAPALHGRAGKGYTPAR